jgi:signal transduction histidine kinase
MSIDWEDWGRTLGRFSRATGLCVSGYDSEGVRRVGPVHDSGVASILAAAGVFRGGGAGSRIESELLGETLETGLPAQRDIAGELTVLCTPVVIGGSLRGALVYGWVFPRFGSPLGCQRLARELGVDPTRLWSAVRLTPPVPPARLVVFTELLETMVAAAVRHADALEQIDAMSQLRKVFLAGVSHELRTPLSALGLRIEMMLRASDLSVPMKESLEKMKQHVRDQARLVEDLIEASRTSTGQLSLDRQPAWLDDVLAAALAATQPQADEKEVEVIARGLREDGSRPLLVDRHRLQQAFWNLLSNAVKFTPPGGRVTLSVDSDDLRHHIVVADNGCGIEAAVLPRIFDAFHKTDAASNRSGLGLGLSIARQIVEGHGGTITASSDGVGKGARFVVGFPRAAVDTTLGSGEVRGATVGRQPSGSA